MTARPEVVELLTDLRMDADVSPHKWTHEDGRPITREELNLAMSATFEEMRAVYDYSVKVADHYEDRAADLTRVQELLGPYFAQLPEGAVTGDALTLMPQAERDEVTVIMQRIAPDGMLYVPGD